MLHSLCVICVICGRITRKRTQSICGRIFTQEYSSYIQTRKPQYISRRSRRFTQINPKTTQTSTCLSLRNNAACCIPLCVICVICGRITRKSTQSIHTNETPMSPADLADDADEPQNQDNKIATITRTTTCLSLRDNAACCIPLRNQRYLRENIHMRVLNLLAQRKPQCLPLISQMTQMNPKRQNNNNHKTKLATNCLSLRNNAACCIPLCVISAICGRIIT